MDAGPAGCVKLIDALKSVSPETDRSDSVAILGRSRSGKSDLTHLPALLATPAADRERSPWMLESTLRRRAVLFILYRSFV
jgi:ABC-type lipoprotein export system ATPase subunit